MFQSEVLYRIGDKKIIENVGPTFMYMYICTYYINATSKYAAKPTIFD